MGQYRIPTAAEAAQAREAGAQRATGPLAVAAHFDPTTGRIVIELDRQCSIAFDPAVCHHLSAASRYELQEIEILGAGTAINFPRIDVSLALGDLVADLVGALK